MYMFDGVKEQIYESVAKLQLFGDDGDNYKPVTFGTYMEALGTMGR